MTVQAAVPPAGHTPSLSSRPLWPWVLVLGGIIVAAVFSAQAYTANQVIQTIESSTGVKIARGIALVSNFIPQLSIVGSLIDQRHQAAYLEAQSRYTEGIFGALVGAVAAVVGLTAAAMWRPRPIVVGEGQRTQSAHGPSGQNAWPTIAAAVVVAAVLLFGVQQLSSGWSSTVDGDGGSTSSPADTTSRGSIGGGQVASGQQTPGAAPSATGTYYRAAPFGPVKVDVKKTYVVQLGSLPRGTAVRAILSVEYNNRLSNTFGQPDIAVHLGDVCKGAGDWMRARNATQINFQVPADGQCSIVFDNSYSAVNAKQVGLQFLQP